MKALGFKNYVQTGIELEVGANATANVAMQLGNVTETIEVTANAAMLETRESTVAQVISEKDVNDLPLNGRYVTQLVLLSGAAITISPASGDLRAARTFIVQQRSRWPEGKPMPPIICWMADITSTRLRT